ncbi:MAG: hypothetical protein ABSB35_34105 [Bryobacteraceae bacterium]
MALTSCQLQTGANSKQKSARADQQEVVRASPTETGKGNNWDRMMQCATRADQWTAAVGLVEGKRQGNVEILGWENHYSPKYERCYLLVSYLNKGGKAEPPGDPISYKELWDAFERKLLATCTGPQFGTSGFCSIEGEKGFDCATCQQFIDDRMKR